MRRRREHDRIRKAFTRTRRQHLAAVRPGIARDLAVGEVALAGEGLVDEAHHRFAVAVEADQRAPDRNAGNEGTRAVDRVDHPDIFPVEADRAVLLAENAVAGKLLLDDGADGRLGGAVALRHRIEAGGLLVDDIGADAEARQGFLPCGIGKAVEEGAIRQHGDLSAGVA